MRNFRSKNGEIDLIMCHQPTLVFIEVCYRHSAHFMHPLIMISGVKQRRLIKTAFYYLKNVTSPIACPVDLILSRSLKTDRLPGLEMRLR